jgi:hypothetical protein
MFRALAFLFLALLAAAPLAPPISSPACSSRRRHTAQCGGLEDRADLQIGWRADARSP